MSAIFRQDWFHCIKIQLWLWNLQYDIKHELSTLTVLWNVSHYIWKYITNACKFTPPLSFLWNTMLGGDLLSRKPNPSNSCSINFLCCKGFSTSKMMKIKLHVRATAITCRPLPLPSLASSMIPGRSSNYNRSVFINYSHKINLQTLKLTADF